MKVKTNPVAKPGTLLVLFILTQAYVWGKYLFLECRPERFTGWILVAVNMILSWLPLFLLLLAAVVLVPLFFRHGANYRRWIVGSVAVVLSLLLLQYIATELYDRRSIGHLYFSRLLALKNPFYYNNENGLDYDGFHVEPCVDFRNEYVVFILLLCFIYLFLLLKQILLWPTKIFNRKS